MLPAGDARQADLKLGAAAYMDMQAAKFLGSDPAPHAAALKFITDRGRVTEADIKKFMTQGIAAVVNQEFNKIKFSLRNTSSSHTAILAFNTETKRYTLSYSGYYTRNETRELSAPTLDALLIEMRKNKTDFDETGVQSVRNHAALMPSSSRIRGSKVASSVLFTEIVTGFYTAKTPEDQNRYYKALLGFDARLQSMILTGEGNSAEPITSSWGAALSAISPELARKSIQDSLNLSNLADLNNEVDRVDSLISLNGW
jgi:hypothetical protein